MKRREFLSGAVAVSAVVLAGEAAAKTTSGKQVTSDKHDLVLKNGGILDGAGNPWFKADIALKNGRISKIGRVDEEGADRIIDVKGLFVSPGFIDMHNHTDTSYNWGYDQEDDIIAGTSPTPPGQKFNQGGLLGGYHSI